MKHEERNSIGFLSPKSGDEKVEKNPSKQVKHFNPQSILLYMTLGVSFHSRIIFVSTSPVSTVSVCVCVCVELAQCRFTPSDCYPWVKTLASAQKTLKFQEQIVTIELNTKASILKQIDNNERSLVMFSRVFVINCNTQTFDGSLESFYIGADKDLSSTGI